MDFGRAKVPVISDEYYTVGARYADRRGRAGAMASLNIPAIASFGRNTSGPRQVLYPGTAKLSGGLLANLIRSPELDPNYVQRFQHIAIIAQLADVILTVAQATGKCIVSVESDSNSDDSAEECTCKICNNEKSKNENSAGSEAQESQQGSEARGKGKGKEKETETEQEIKSDNHNNTANGESAVDGAKYQEVSQEAGGIANTIEESA